MIRSEALSEAASPLSSESRQSAALLSSKLYFYLGSLEEAVDAALAAGAAFARDNKASTVDPKSATRDASTREYQETIIARCLDRAILQRDQGEEVDERLKSIVEEVLEGNIAAQQVGSAGASKLVNGQPLEWVLSTLQLITLYL
jgi:26S proteasome regulatory subunit N2